MATKDEAKTAGTGDVAGAHQERADLEAAGVAGGTGSMRGRGLGGAIQGAGAVEGHLMRFVDTTLTDTVHVTGHVASEVVATAANVLGDVVGGVVDIFRRGLTGGYRGRSGEYGQYGMSPRPTMGEEMRREEGAAR